MHGSLCPAPAQRQRTAAGGGDESPREQPSTSLGAAAEPQRVANEQAQEDISRAVVTGQKALGMNAFGPAQDLQHTLSLSGLLPTLAPVPAPGKDPFPLQSGGRDGEGW